VPSVWEVLYALDVLLGNFVGYGRVVCAFVYNDLPHKVRNTIAKRINMFISYAVMIII